MRVNLWAFLCPVCLKPMISNSGFTPTLTQDWVLWLVVAHPSAHTFLHCCWANGGGGQQFKRGSPKLELPLCFLYHLRAHSAATVQFVRHWEEKALLMITGILETCVLVFSGQVTAFRTAFVGLLQQHKSYFCYQKQGLFPSVFGDFNQFNLIQWLIY